DRGRQDRHSDGRRARHRSRDSRQAGLGGGRRRHLLPLQRRGGRRGGGGRSRGGRAVRGLQGRRGGARRRQAVVRRGERGLRAGGHPGQQRGRYAGQPHDAHERGRVRRGLADQPQGDLPVHAGGDAADGAGAVGQDRQRLLGGRSRWQRGAGQLRGLQGRHHRVHQERGAGGGAEGDHGERRGARVRGDGAHGGFAGEHQGADPGAGARRAVRGAGGDRRGRGVFRLGGRGVRHRADAGGRRRDDYAV
ncbi:MAG: 3-oxoacyl-[acyl-carrier protein] reductase, partial [uncultured Rubrobacteraceae bacterium]